MVNKYFSSRYLIYWILVCSFLVRLYGFSNPIADWHSWRQADTSAVSRNFVKNGYDLLHPRFDDLSNIASGFDNPNGYRFVEFPIYNLAQAGLSRVLVFLSIEQAGRLVTIIGSLCSVFFLFSLMKRYFGVRVGLITALCYGLIPYNIYYGRVILPDPSMVAATLGSIYFFDRWISDKKHSFPLLLFSMLCGSASLLLKPYAAFFLLPILFLAIEHFKLKIILQWKLWLFAIVVTVPFILWRIWIKNFPEGIPVSDWLYNGNGIRFRPAFFRWILYERITRLISGYVGVVLLLLGSLQLVRMKKYLIVGSSIIASILYICIFATGNVQHDYYQILIMPTVAMVMALGIEWLLTLKKEVLGVKLGLVLVTVLCLGTFIGGWKQVGDYFNINNRSLMIAGEAVDRLTPKDAKVAALYDGDTSFLYQTNRQGWPSLQNGLDDLIKKGASYLVFANPTPDNYRLGAPYKILSESKEHVIFDLHTKR